MYSDNIWRQITFFVTRKNQLSWIFAEILRDFKSAKIFAISLFIAKI